jgi:hypothetical protein
MAAPYSKWVLHLVLESAKQKNGAKGPLTFASEF